MHRGSRSHAVKRAQGTNRTSTIACRSGLVPIKSHAPVRMQVSVSIHCPQGIRLLLTRKVKRISKWEESASVDRIRMSHDLVDYGARLRRCSAAGKPDAVPVFSR